MTELDSEKLVVDVLPQVLDLQRLVVVVLRDTNTANLDQFLQVPQRKQRGVWMGIRMVVTASGT